MRVGPLIDYTLIAEAMSFYTHLGYTPVEVPWIVPHNISYLTCHDDDLVFWTKTNKSNMGRALVGSAEQGLLDLIISKSLPLNKKYVSCSPCFRVNNDDSPIHFDQFMKVELGWAVTYDQISFYLKEDRLNLCEVTDLLIYQLIHHAESFFESQTTKPLSRVDTDEGIDLTINDIEIGSYGFRPISYRSTDSTKLTSPFVWVYGTGLALPRFTQAISSDDDGNP